MNEASSSRVVAARSHLGAPRRRDPRTRNRHGGRDASAQLKDASGKPETGFVWTFGAQDSSGGLDITYHFADSRSGATPKSLLEGTKGVLLVDGYSGYNDVENVSSRRRAACFAHVRRYFFEAIKTAPIAQEALDMITELYRVEHDAKEQRLSETSHLEFRKRALARSAIASAPGSRNSSRGIRRRARSGPRSDTRAVNGTSSESSSTTRASPLTTTALSAR